MTKHAQNNELSSVSVIVPVFNNEESIRKSLGSLFSQTFDAIEIIVVNDASTDRTGEILDQLVESEPRLKVIHLRENLGTHQARKTGLAHSDGDWIGFFDADDFASPNLYYELHKANTTNNTEISICGVWIVNKDGKYLRKYVQFPKNKVISNNIFSRFCRMEFGTGVCWNKLYSRELILEHGVKEFRWRQDISEDTLVNIGCFLDAQSISLVSSCLYEYVQHGNSVTGEIQKVESFSKMIRAYALALDIYGGKGEAVLQNITLHWSRLIMHLQISKIKDLKPFRSELEEAVKLICRIYPFGLAALSNRGLPGKQMEAPSNKRTTFRKMVRKILGPLINSVK